MAGGTARPGAPAAALRLAASLLALGGLWLAAQGFLAAPGWAIALAVAALAVPIAAARIERAQLLRRAMLAGLLAPESRLRRVLWPGAPVAFAEAVLAAVLALLMLAIASGLEPLHWAVLAADAALLALAAGPAERALARTARQGAAGALARRGLFLGNLALLALAFFAADYWLGAPDTRGQDWETVALEAFAAAAGAETELARWLGGGFAAADALAWHLSQLAIPALPEGLARLAGWALVLAGAGWFALAATQFLLGALALAAPARTAAGARKTPAAAGLGLLAAAGLLALAVGPPRLAPEEVRARVVRAAGLVDPCGGPVLGAEAVSDGLRARLAEGEAATARAADARLADFEARLARESARGIEAYLDWHFSVAGEYARLAARATGGLEALLAERLAPALTGGERLAARIAGMEAEIVRLAGARMRAAAGAAAEETATRLGEAGCLGPRLAGRAPLARLGEAATALAATPIPEGAIAAGGLALAPAIRAAALRAAGGRLAGGTARAASRVAAGAAARRGGGWLAAGAVCAPSGPLAALCGVAGAAASWLAIDLAAVGIAERRDRPRLEAALTRAASEARAEATARLRQASAARSAALARAHAARLETVFIPARDG
jgi:hypothetical protein